MVEINKAIPIVAERLSTSEFLQEDLGEVSLRPLTLKDFTGQAPVRANLSVFIEAARTRGDAMDHVLLFGPPGWVKQLWHKLLPENLVLDFAPPLGPSLRVLEILPLF